MPRIACRVDYDGSNYSGWQRQPEGTRTVQSAIEGTLSKLFSESIAIIGCGRTDAGVHARGYLFHFDLANEEEDFDKTVYKANKILDRDIALIEMETVSETFHARFDAKSRSYLYKMHLGKAPFLDQYSFQYPYRKEDINLTELNKAADVLLGTHDFSAFCKTGSDVGTHLCTLTKSHWLSGEHGLEYHVSADRFLRGMIRLIVGMCINVSRGKLTHDTVESALLNANRLPLDWSVPGKGLTLLDIEY